MRRRQILRPTLLPDAMERLTAYDWPGNVRELRNVAERLVVRRKPALDATDLPAEVRRAVQSPASSHTVVF